MKKFLKDESGQGMVEYGLIIALVAVAIVAVVAGLGGKLKGKFTAATDALDTTPAP